MSASNTKMHIGRCASAFVLSAVCVFGGASSGHAQPPSSARVAAGNLHSIKAVLDTSRTKTTATPLLAAELLAPKVFDTQSQSPKNSDNQTLVVTPTAAPLPDRLYNAKAIGSFLQRLQGKLDQTLHVVQIGDSHTAGDLFTGSWRSEGQQRYGRGGRGVLPAGRPYRGYMTMGVTAGQTDGWTTNSLMGRQYSKDGPALGFTGFTQTARISGAKLTLAADNSNFMFDKFSLCGVTGPEMGAVRVILGSVTQEFSFSAPKIDAACFDVLSSNLESRVEVETLSDQPVSLTSWTTMRSSGGLIISNLGVVGSRFHHFARNSDTVLARELTRTRPDLVVVAFGTNEGYDPDLRIENAAATMRAQIERIRKLLGYKVPFMLIGPPDVVTQKHDVALPNFPETVVCANGWFVPGNIMRMRQMEIDLAKQMDLAFWDLQGAMGGPCSSLSWVAQGMQSKDHVHFTAIGGGVLGRLLAADLDQARVELTGG